MRVRMTPVILFVRDFERCFAFYRDVFELEPVRVYHGPDHPDWAEFDLNGVRLALHGGHGREERYAPGRPLTVHFDVEDIYRALARVPEAGGEVVAPPTEYDFRPVELQRVLAASFRDPDGNVFELQQVLEEFVEGA